MDDQMVLFAVSKLLKTKFEPTNGSTKVTGTVTIDVDAIINKSNDELYAPTIHIPYIRVIAEFVKLSGITRNIALKNFKEAMTISLNDDVDASEELDNMVSELDKFEEIVRSEVIDKLPKQIRKGKVSVKGDISLKNTISFVI